MSLVFFIAEFNFKIEHSWVGNVKLQSGKNVLSGVILFRDPNFTC